MNRSLQMFLFFFFLNHISFASFDSTINILLNKAVVYQSEKKCDSSLVTFEKTLKLLQITNNQLLKIEAYKKAAWANYKCHEYDQSVKYYKHCIELKINTKSFNLSDEYLRISYIFIDQGLTDSAFAYVEKARDYVEYSENNLIISFIENQSGRIKLATGNFDDALMHFFNGLEPAVNNKDTLRLIQYYTNIAGVYLRLKNYDKSLDYYHQAHELSKITNNLHGLAASYSIGVVYRKKGDFSKAIQYYNQAIEPCLKVNRMIDLVNIYSNLANVYTLSEKYDTAIAYLRKSISISTEKGYQRQLASALSSMGETKKYQNQSDSAIFFFKESIAIFERIKNLGRKSRTIELMSDAYEYHHDYQNALFYYRQHVQLSDSLDNIKIKERIAEIETRYETEKKEKENITLRADNEMKRLSLSMKNIIIYSLVAGALIILLMLALTYRQYKLKDDAYQVLVKQNLNIARNELYGIISEEKNSALDSSKKANSEKPGSEEDQMFTELIHKLSQYFKDEKPYLDCKLNLEDLSKILNTNRSYLSRAINDYMNKSFYDLLNEYRLSEARLLLINHNYNHISIEGIGQMVGFSSRSSFYNCFKKYFGITPSYFRRAVPNEHHNS